MTVKTIDAELPNLLVWVHDPGRALSRSDLPEIVGRAGVWSTPVCVAVTGLPYCDGPTHISIGPISEVMPAKVLIFDAPIETPSRRLCLDTVQEEVLVEVDVPNTSTRLRIWTDGYLDSEIIVIGYE